VNQGKTILRKATGVDSFLVGDELLLYSAAARAMFRLNGSAAFIWDCIEDGLDHAAIVNEVAATFSIDKPRADADLSGVLQQWRSLGLIGDSKMTFKTIRDVDSAHPADADPGCCSFDSRALLHECYYRLFDLVLRLRYPDEDIQDSVDAVLMQDARVTKQDHDIALDVWRDDQGYYLLEDASIAAQCATKEELPPLLLAHTASLAYLNTQRLVGLHAAAISRDNRCIIFPAVSGSGKSTLTAALVACGYDYCTDELVLIMRDSPEVRTARVAMSTKSGSWPVLRTYYPDIYKSPRYLRADGKTVRYLLPRGSPAAAFDKGSPVLAVVFPRYQRGHTASLSIITAGDALCRVTEAGYDMDGGLDRQSVAALIDWISGRPCYELLFDDLDDAVTIIDGLLP
jgi:hypothetical protein